MAVTVGSGAADLPGATTALPSTWCFVRLKLRLLANSLRGSTQRTVAVLSGAMFGLVVAILGFSGFAAGAGAPLRPDIRFVMVVGIGTLATGGWLLLPLLFFGVDETLDPARFALLPLPRRVLVRGMLAAACVGIPPLMTFAAMLGLVVGAVLRGAPAVAGFALASVVVALVECVVLSRAMTSAFATMLRSRRMRDLAAIAIALLASSIAPLQASLSVLLQRGDLGRLLGIAQILAWTPLAAPYAGVVDATAGRWSTALARLAVSVGTVVVLLWWWSRTLESAMLAGGSQGVGSRGSTVRPGSAGERGLQPVDALFPAPLRWLPRTTFTAIMVRELRYWLREPRRRASAASLVVSSSVVPLMLRLPVMTGGQGRAGLPLPIVMSFSGIVIAIVLANQLGMDGSAYALHLLTGVRGRVELLARGAALAVFGLPLLVVVTLAIGLISGANDVPAALGIALAAFGVSLGIASLISVRAAYPMPDTSNPFAMTSGSGSAKSGLSFLALFAAVAGSAPMFVMYVLLPGSLSAMLGPVGIAWGMAAAGLGAYIAGDQLDRRGPEILLAVTPRR